MKKFSFNIGFFAKMIIIFVLLLPVKVISSEVSDEELGDRVGLPDSQLQLFQNNLENIVNEASEESYLNHSPRSRSDIEALFGTWVLSYTVGSHSSTDQIIINDIYTNSDGKTRGVGLYFADQTGEGKLIVCGYTPEDSIKIDYMCATSSNDIYQGFAFRFSDNAITNGYYGIGSGSNMQLDIVSKRYPLTGYRDVSQDTSEVIYDDINDRLLIPRVKYRDSYFRVILKNKGDFIFFIEEVELTQ